MTKGPSTAIEKVESIRNRIAIFVVGAFVGALIAFTFWTIPEGNKDIITYMVGQLSGMATTALGFYFINKVGQDAADAKRADNTGKALEAITTVAQNTGGAASDPNTPAGTEDDPLHTKVDQPAEEPIPVTGKAGK